MEKNRKQRGNQKKRETRGRKGGEHCVTVEKEKKKNVLKNLGVTPRLSTAGPRTEGGYEKRQGYYPCLSRKKGQGKGHLKAEQVSWGVKFSAAQRAVGGGGGGGGPGNDC